ncbi:hypothetical protein DACRYDRAFT_60009, partial [Dacryopinax primogenitus]
LCSLCPACFALDCWGQASERGSDILIALNSNCQLKRLWTEGSTPHFHETELFVSSSKVAEMCLKMDQAKEQASSQEVPPNT